MQFKTRRVRTAAGRQGLPAAGATTILVSAILASVQSADGLRMVKQVGGRLDWLANAPFSVAYDALGSSGASEVYTMNPDGSGSRCVTCNSADLPPGLSRGNPAWHPSGNFIVFQAARPNDFTGTPREFFTGPGQGIFNNLWLTDAAGRRCWKLVTVGPRGGVLHAHFSPDGKKLLWTERLGPGRTRAGEWALKVAQFDASGPRIGNVKSYQPLGQGALESHGFTPDGRGIIFTASRPGGAFGDTNIYTMDLASLAVVNLTNMTREWNEHAHYSHDGRHIIWSSSSGSTVQREADGTVAPTGDNLDLWMMDADGAHKRRLTSINSRGSAAYDPGLGAASDGDWAPDDRKYMFYIVRPHRRANRFAPVGGQIWVLSLAANG